MFLSRSSAECTHFEPMKSRSIRSRSIESWIARLNSPLPSPKLLLWLGFKNGFGRRIGFPPIHFNSLKTGTSPDHGGSPFAEGCSDFTPDWKMSSVIPNQSDNLCPLWLKKWSTVSWSRWLPDLGSWTNAVHVSAFLPLYPRQVSVLSSMETVLLFSVVSILNDRFAPRGASHRGSASFRVESNQWWVLFMFSVYQSWKPFWKSSINGDVNLVGFTLALCNVSG